MARKKNEVSKVKKEVKKHLRDDIETFHHEASDDKELIKKLSGKKKKVKKKRK